MIYNDASRYSQTRSDWPDRNSLSDMVKIYHIIITIVRLTTIRRCEKKNDGTYRESTSKIIRREIIGP